MDALDFVATADDEDDNDDGLPDDMSPLTTAARGCQRKQGPKP